MSQDMIDPRTIRVVEGPNINDYPATAQITEVRFTSGDFLVRHTKEGKRPDSWKGSHIPGWGNGKDDPGTIQWTLWVAVRRGNEWLTAGCIEFWPEDHPSKGVHKGGDPAPFSTARQNWYYDMPGGMSAIQPGPGDEIGICVTQGSQRKKDIHDVRERSNWVKVVVPAHNSGEYRFDAAPAPQPGPSPDPALPEPTHPQAEPPRLEAMIQDLLNRLGNMEEADRRQQQQIDELKARPGGKKLIRGKGYARIFGASVPIAVDNFEYEP